MKLLVARDKLRSHIIAGFSPNRLVEILIIFNNSSNLPTDSLQTLSNMDLAK